MNSVTISGNLTKNAELKYIGQNNLPCLTFCIAQNKTFKNERGNIEKKPMLFDITFFGKYAEKICPSLIKGTQVFVQGELSQDTWEYQGKKHSHVRIIGHGINIINRNPMPQNQAQNAQAQQPQNAQNSYQAQQPQINQQVNQNNNQVIEAATI